MGIHTTVPESKREPKLDARQLAGRLERLLPYLWGKAKARTSHEIMRLLGLRASGTNQPLRAAAKILLHEKGLAVISGSRGFYFATSMQEIEEWEEKERARASAVLRNVRKIREIKSEYSRLLDAEPDRPRQQQTMFGVGQEDGRVA